MRHLRELQLRMRGCGSGLVLGIESSCDDTGVAVLEAPRRIRSSLVMSQVEEHAPHGGVVPELASRRHQEAVVGLVRRCLAEAGVLNPMRELSLIAVTAGPGLMGSLLVGLMAAKGLSQGWEVPMIGVNHMEGHVFANVIAHEDLEPPFLCLVVSGGHTEIQLVRSFGDYRFLGGTRDDAAGEAYDKVAKLLGLGYPGGPVIDRLAAQGDPRRYQLPVPLRGTSDVEFSFSGLKTAVLWLVRKEGDSISLPDLCASFQRSAVDSLVEKLELAVQLTGVKTVAASGGVAANSELRRRLLGLSDRGIRVFLPPRDLCTDNGAMIAAAGWWAFMRGIRDDLTLRADPSWEMAR
ncbi:putative glycoprotease GCP [Thermanaerovibrio velox DSM 12556]|uniref:tRNA N6-adenosine threonylcarbamoyltransferase n=2 Tax=Thermanaerovibrio TaxID=81461 RepID=H0UQD9_9BACT|nr:putative glycoprotease GCP [Thermanaerovibrio velox DSM 12556]